MDGRVGDPKITIDLKDVTLGAALRAVGRSSGLDIHLEDRVVVFGEKPAPDTFRLGREGQRLRDALDEVKLPSVRFDEATINEGLAYVGMKTKEFAPSGSILKRHWLNRVLLETPEVGLTVSLERLSASEVLRYLAAQLGAKVRIERNAVVVGADLPPEPVALSASERKLNELMLSEFDSERANPDARGFGDATLAQIARYLEDLAAESGWAGVKIRAEGEDLDHGIYLKLRDVSLWEVLRYTAMKAGAELSIDDEGVVLTQSKEKDRT